MEKNTVLLSLETYNELIDALRKAEFTINSLECEFQKTEYKFKSLWKFAVEKSVIEYRLETKELEELLNFNSYGCAISKEDLKCLLDAGIDEYYIKSIIQRMKEKHDGN
ncbi:hypothetical protein [Methanobrevibacter sp.]|uniref:hypothetical protein n=1 Tax=Methanobrevibacter sp. TaxID=66852 RepID=UPI00388E319D